MGICITRAAVTRKKMMDEIFTQAQSAGIRIAYVQFIGTNTTMDNISMDAKARLWTLNGDNSIGCSEEAALKDINEMAVRNDKELAELIYAGKIDGMMLLSCDPKGTNKRALTAAAEKQIPLAGDRRHFHGKYAGNGLQGDRCVRNHGDDESHKSNLCSFRFFKRVENKIQPDYRILCRRSGAGGKCMEAH